MTAPGRCGGAPSSGTPASSARARDAAYSADNHSCFLSQAGAKARARAKPRTGLQVRHDGKPVKHRGGAAFRPRRHRLPARSFFCNGQQNHDELSWTPNNLVGAIVRGLWCIDLLAAILFSVSSLTTPQKKKNMAARMQVRFAFCSPPVVPPVLGPA